MMSSTSPSIELIGSVRSESEVLFGDLRLAVRANQWTCLLGASGIGKSTILRLIAGLPTHVKLDGSIKSNDHLPISNRVSYMAQNDLLIPWATVSANVSLGNKLRGEKFSPEKKLKIIEKVGLMDHKKKYPFQLSGGQQKLVALARAMVVGKNLLLLDEPFEGVAPALADRLVELISSLNKSNLITMITESDETFSKKIKADIIRIERGKIL